MITAGSITRDEAAEVFEFLRADFRGRRKVLNKFTHTDPDFVFWIYPDGKLHDARNAHISNYPKGFAHILKDEPDYCGFLRGRIATKFDHQLIVVYCRPETLYTATDKMRQFLDGVSSVPVPVREHALVVSDNADLYGTLSDVERRLGQLLDGSLEIPSAS